LFAGSLLHSTCIEAAKQTQASQERALNVPALGRSHGSRQINRSTDQPLSRSTRDESTIKQQQESTCRESSSAFFSLVASSPSLSSPLSRKQHGSQHRHHCDTSRRIVLLDRELLRVSLALASRTCKLRDHFVAWSRTCLRRPIARCSFMALTLDDRPRALSR